MKSKTFKKALALTLSLAMIICSLATFGGVVATAESTLPTTLQNGNFENGTTGWSITPNTNGNPGTLTAVNAAQDASHTIRLVDGYAGYYTTGHTSTWLYQGVRLQPGKYTWEYTSDLIGTYYFMGAYTSIENIGKAAGLIEADTFSAVKHDGTVSTGYKLKTNYYQLYLGAGKGSYTFTWDFTIENATDVYFAVKANQGGIQYIDNMTLTGDKLLNGDFETGDLSGFLNASGSAIKVVNTAQVEGDATTFSGYAAYMPGGAANTANTLLQAVKLPAGSYVWKFDTDLIITKSGWSFLFGVYTNLKNTGVGYGSGSSIGTANGVNNKTGTALSVPATGQNGFYISAGLQTIDATIEVKFTLEAETVVYLDIRTSANGHSYIDNMTLETSKTLDTTLYDFDENGQFDDSFVVSDSNQASENLKVEVIDSEEAEYNNVLKLPKYDNTDRGATARFYKMLDGLTVGNTYKVTFDLKFADYTADKASDWIALTGVSSTNDRPLNLASGADIITYSAGTLGNITKLPAKVVTYTSNDNDYTVAANENGRNAIIMWNGGRDWATYTMEFVAESEEYFFYIENYLAKTDLYVDNIQFALSDEQLDAGLDKTVIQDESVPSVLIIGNSFAGDTFREFKNILNASSENKLRVGKYGKGAQSPQYFANQINNGSLGADFCYAEKGYTGNSTLSDAVSFDNVLELTDWDYVLIQTTTINYNETFEGYTVELVNALVAKGFEKSQIYLYIPWNARQDYLDRNGNFTSTATQMTALDNYVATLEANENLSDCNIMSVHNEIYDLQKFIVNIHRGTYGVSDGLHLNRIGQTAVSMTLFHKFTGVDVTDSSVFDYQNLDFTDNKWADNDGGVITQIQLDALKVIANGVEPQVEYGDANYDGDIDVRDLVRGKKLIADEKYTIGADCVEDEELNSEDLTLLRQWLLGIKEEEVNSLNLEG